MLKVSDLGAGLAIASLGLAIVGQSQSFPAFGGMAVGPSFYPGVIGAILFLCGAALVVTSLVDRRGLPLASVPDWARRPANALAVVAVPVAIIAYGVFSPVLGFIATGFFVTLGLLLCFRARLVASLIVSVALIVALHVIFVVVMRVPLPYGFVESVLP